MCQQQEEDLFLLDVLLVLQLVVVDAGARGHTGRLSLGFTDETISESLMNSSMCLQGRRRALVA